MDTQPSRGPSPQGSAEPGDTHAQLRQGCRRALRPQEGLTGVKHPRSLGSTQRPSHPLTEHNGSGLFNKYRPVSDGLYHTFEERYRSRSKALIAGTGSQLLRGSENQ